VINLDRHWKKSKRERKIEEKKKKQCLRTDNDDK